jgi:hypothetical protein
MKQLPHVCSMLVFVGLRRGIATHASPTAQPCGDYLDLEGEKEALVLVHPHIDVICLIDVTGDDGDGDAGDTVQVLLKVYGGGSRHCRPGPAYLDNGPAVTLGWNARISVGEANCSSWAA